MHTIILPQSLVQITGKTSKLLHFGNLKILDCYTIEIQFMDEIEQMLGRDAAKIVVLPTGEVALEASTADIAEVLREVIVKLT